MKPSRGAKLGVVLGGHKEYIWNVSKTPGICILAEKNPTVFDWDQLIAEYCSLSVLNSFLDSEI